MAADGTSSSPSSSRDALIEAGLALASELSLPIVLQRIVDLAVQLTDARYGALGVLGPEDAIAQFVTTGMSAQERERIGTLPTGRGVLGVLVSDPHLLRLHDISRDPRSVGFPPNHPPMRTFLGSPVKAMGRVFGNIYLTDKRGGLDFTEEDERELVVLATQAGVAIANATLYEQAMERERWLEAIRQVGAAILEGRQLSELLDLVVRLARELAQADLGLLATIEGSGDEPAVRASDGGVAEDMAGPSMAVPLQVWGRRLGELSLVRQRGRPPFTESQHRLARTFADQAAVALDYERARQDSERVAIMDDRERIARELHDGIIQSLYALGMNLQVTAIKLDDAASVERLDTMVTEVDGIIRDLRNYIFGLRPGILADRQLDQALHALADDIFASSPTSIEVSIDPRSAARLAMRAVQILQLAREALSNVSRHAGATSCQLSLSTVDGTAVLEISDNGAGFEPERVELGQGLVNMRDRVGHMGGSFAVESLPGEGTRIRISIPE